MHSMNTTPGMAMDHLAPLLVFMSISSGSILLVPKDPSLHPSLLHEALCGQEIVPDPRLAKSQVVVYDSSVL